MKGCGLQESQLSKELEGAIPVTLAGKEKTVRKELSEGAELLVLIFGFARDDGEQAKAAHSHEGLCRPPRR